MEIKPKNTCPLNNFEPCKELECGWFMKVVGKDPQSNKDIEEWGCAVTWMPILTIENSQQQRHTSAAVESFRNEMVKSNETSQQVLLQATAAKLALVGNK
tara:strand:- start:17 stop:316 length:300 start_codon:yes stop_codon:yes gene_type:complete